MLNKIIDKAKIGVMMDGSVFLSTILFSLKQSWDETIPTATTDGLTLLINPTWFTSITEKERVGLLCHEAYHVAFNHMLRLGDKDQAIEILKGFIAALSGGKEEPAKDSVDYDIPF